MFQEFCVILLLGAVASLAQADTLSEECEKAIPVLLQSVTELFNQFYQHSESIFQAYLANEEVRDKMDGGEAVYKDFVATEREFNEYVKELFDISRKIVREALSDLDLEKFRTEIDNFFDSVRPFVDQIKEVKEALSNHV